MRPNVRKALDELGKVLLDFSSPESVHDAKDLWDILTALRGPDNGDASIKKTTTAVLRTMTFLKEGEGAKPYDLTLRIADFAPFTTPFNHGVYEEDHFTIHAVRAFRALKRGE